MFSGKSVTIHNIVNSKKHLKRFGSNMLFFVNQTKNQAREFFRTKNKKVEESVQQGPSINDDDPGNLMI